MIQEKNIGIDFGTTNTVIYTRDAKGKTKKIGGKSIRTAVYFLSRTEFMIGEDALNASASGNVHALVVNFKPDIMEKFSIIAENGDSFKLKGETVAKLFLSKILTDYVEPRFQKFFDTAEMTEHDKTVITVPAKFTAEQKGKVKKAAKNAYFCNVQLAFEPTAAAIAALDTDIDDDLVAVYDFGGGTFDVSIIEKDGSHHFIPIEEDGDTQLGGNDITDCIVKEIFLPELQKQGIILYIDAEDMEFDDEEFGNMSEEEYIYNMRTIRNRVEDMKENFSESDEELEQHISILHEEKTSLFSFTVTKQQFESAIYSLVQKTVSITRRVIEHVKKRGKYVRKIVMAGGSSQLSLAEKMLVEEFEHEGIQIIMSDSGFDLISKGALLMAEQQKLIRIDEKTTTQFGVGIRTGVGIKKFDMLIDADQPLPISSSKRFSIDSHILLAGEFEIPCYEKDVKRYPDSMTERDKGITHINTYRIGFDRTLNPSEIEVLFRIETDGTLCMSAELYDGFGKPISNFDAEIMSDSELE